MKQLRHFLYNCICMIVAGGFAGLVLLGMSLLAMKIGLKVQ